MSKFVSFSTVQGGVVGKPRKRLRGDNNRKPEIKKCDLAGGSTYSYLIGVCNYLHNVPSGQQAGSYLYNHTPKQIAWPGQGVTGSGYIGSSLFLKYIRLKGYLLTKPNDPVQIRWRLVLVRIDWSGLDTASFSNADHYLGLYKPTSVMLTSSMNSFDNTVLGAARNFYAKQKDVEEWAGIKRVVIATGVMPPSTQYHTDYGQIYLPGGQLDEVSVSQTNNVGYAENAGYRGYSPIDVKVTLNDRINVTKNTVRYYLIFESDCGIGYPWQSAIIAEGRDARLMPRVDWPSESPIQLMIQGTVYYTDA